MMEHTMVSHQFANLRSKSWEITSLNNPPLVIQKCGLLFTEYTDYRKWKWLSLPGSLAISPAKLASLLKKTIKHFARNKADIN